MPWNHLRPKYIDDFYLLTTEEFNAVLVISLCAVKIVCVVVLVFHRVKKRLEHVLGFCCCPSHQ